MRRHAPDLLQSDSNFRLLQEVVMSMSHRLADYLERHRARYEVCAHPHSHTSAQTARLAHIPEHQLAKSVLLEDDEGYVMAVVPADTRVRVGELARLLGRSTLHLADESRIKAVFDDCEPGAVPAFGMAWGVQTVVDDELQENAEIYVEGGDHEVLVRMSGEQFNALMREAKHGRFSRPIAH
jgi:Ala-tRNA(Pro) deacylase